MAVDAPPPIVALGACLRESESGPYHYTGDKYVLAVTEAVGAMPLILPALAKPGFFDPLLDQIDGLMLTGSPSNIEPHRYKGGDKPEDDISDSARDETILSLIPKAIAKGIPVLGLCRGIQEINVALGGTLFKSVHEVPGRFDHRSDKTVPHHERYDVRHPVTIHPGGLLHKIQQTERIEVNSLHAQGVDRVAPALRVDAVAEDGTVEAISLRSGRSFCLGVQWHPEWRPLEYEHYLLIFEAFRDACRARAIHRRDHAADRAMA